MHNGKITVEAARAIAEKEVEHIIGASERLRQYHFDPPLLGRETEDVWVFVAGSAELIEQGIVPGAIQVSIDKTDGHVWNQAELERDAQQREQAPLAAPAKSFRSIRGIKTHRPRVENKEPK